MVAWEIVLLVWIVGIPLALLATAEIAARRRRRVRRTAQRAGSLAPLIQLAPRAGSAKQRRAAG